MQTRNAGTKRLSVGLSLFLCLVALLVTGPATARAQTFGDELPLDIFGQGGEGGAPKKATATAIAFPKQGKRADLKAGDTIVLAVTLSFPADSYTYSQSTPNGQKTRITLSQAEGVVTEGLPKDFRKQLQPKFVAERKAKRSFSVDFEGDVEKFLKPITWYAEFPLSKDTSADAVQFAGQLRGQTCNAQNCIPFTLDFKTELTQRPDNITLPSERQDQQKVSQELELLRRALVRQRLTQVEQSFAWGEDSPVTTNMQLSPANARVGSRVTLELTVNLDDGWHTYSLTQPDGQAAARTEIRLGDFWGLKEVGSGWQSVQEYESKEVEVGNKTVLNQIHKQQVTWKKEFEVVSANVPGYGVSGVLDFQYCSKQTCVPTNAYFALASPLGDVFVAGAAPTREPDHSATNDSANKTASTDSSVANSPGNKATRDSSGQGLKSSNLLIVALTAAAGGFFALLTPCVFPMIPITVSFFLKQAEKEHHSPLKSAIVYSLTIICTFTLVGVIFGLLQQGFGATDLANNFWLNVFISAVLVFFGLSMLGFFEITLPGWMLSWSSTKEQKGGLAGTIFMAITFTLVSFTCTFPIAGFALVSFQQGEFIRPVIAMLSFATVFAAPFFFLALFPSFMKNLPKSGGWMNNVKVVFGLLEIGAALKFVSVAEFALTRQQAIFTWEVVLLSWFALAVIMVLYIVGIVRFPHDDEPQMFAPVRLAFAIPFLLLALNLAKVAAYPQRTDFPSDEAITALLPPKLDHGANSTGDPSDPSVILADLPEEVGPTANHHGIEYAQNYQQALAYAKSANVPILVDFTGVNCPNCRTMERKMAQQPYLDAVQPFVRVQVYVDIIPRNIASDPEEADRILQFNQQLQTSLLSDTSMPSYAILAPDGEKLLDKYMGAEVAGGPSFVDFLKEGYQEWQQVSQAAGEDKAKLLRVSQQNSANTR